MTLREFTDWWAPLAPNKCVAQLALVQRLLATPNLAAGVMAAGPAWGAGGPGQTPAGKIDIIPAVLAGLTRPIAAGLNENGTEVDRFALVR
jgi:hypothetical protein